VTRNVRAEFMTSPEIARYLQRNDLAILPVGCFEMHGPHVPLNCDTFHAYAMSVILAELWDCIVLPPVAYTFPGASGPWPGTIAPRPSATEAYVKEICLAAGNAGFKRLVVLATHGPLGFILQSVIREIHQETGRIVLHLAPVGLMPPELMKDALGYERGEDILVLASAQILGLDAAPGAPQPLVRLSHADTPDRCFPFESISGLRRAECQMPWTFSEPWQHQPVRSCVRPEHADKAVEVMRRAARERYAAVPELFTRFQHDLAALEAAAPWALGRVAEM